MSPTPGYVLADGPYELVEPVGRGGMGEVWRARHLQLDRPAAVKLLLRRDGADEDWLDGARRLRDEARATARVVHPALVELYDTGEDPDLGPWIAFEFLEGGNLRQTLRARRTLPLAQTMERVAEPLLSALAALHGAGTVHRDVKPENLLAGPDGRFKLGDLGLAVFADREARTRTGILIGTPGYMPPETFESAAPAGPATDVYAAAMVLVECLAGRLPFDAPSAAERMRQQLTIDPSSSFLQALGVPPPLAPILAAAVTRDPHRRSDCARDLLRVLRHAAADAASARPPANEVTRSQGRAVALPTRPMSRDRSSTASAVSPPAAPAAQRRFRTGPLLLAGALVLALALVSLTPRGAAPRHGEPPELVRLRQLLLTSPALPDDDSLTRLALLLPDGTRRDLPPPHRALVHLIEYAASRGAVDRSLALMSPLPDEPATRKALGQVVSGTILPALTRRSEEAAAAWFHAGRHDRQNPPELRTTIDECSATLGRVPPPLLSPDERLALALLRLRLAACRADPPARLEAFRLARTAHLQPETVGDRPVPVMRDAAIILAFSAGPVEAERRLARDLMTAALARATQEFASPDVVARLSVTLAAIHLRALSGDISSASAGINDAERLLKRIDQTPLPEPTRLLLQVMLAWTAACRGNDGLVTEISQGLDPGKLLVTDRWWFYRARTEPSLFITRPLDDPEDTARLRELAPDYFVNYLRMRGTTSNAEDVERYGLE